MTPTETTLAAYKNWLLKTAWEYSNNGDDAQDLAQEGYIAMWKAFESHDPSRVKLSTHLMNKARWRMAEVRQRGTFTGKPTQQGKRHSVGTQANAGAERSTDFGLSDIDPASVTREQSEDVALVYHHAEIMEALKCIKPEHRAKVVDWFWRGIVDQKNSSWWYQNVRPKLRERLEHLQELVK